MEDVWLSQHEPIQENQIEETNLEQKESRVCAGKIDQLPSLYREKEVIQLPQHIHFDDQIEGIDCSPDLSRNLKIQSRVSTSDLRSVTQKVDTLYTKIQDLKKEHVVLTGEISAINGEQFSTSEIASAFELLKNDNETRKKELIEVKRKLVEESLERKQLYNEVIDLKGNIRVFCRCRPLNQDEIASGTSSVVDIDSSRETELQINSTDSSKKQFKFDHVFGPGDTQDAVFAQTSPLVTSVLDGFNVCIFAYGQTGTGKTFTMEGTPENRGVNYRTLEELFRISNERSTIMKYELFVSMLEVYNEKIRDLLVENSTQNLKKLEIKQAAEGTQEIPGLVEARAYSTDEVWELLKKGSRNRAVGSTNANELSSRSHCLFRVTVKGENLVNGQRSKSHLWLVDLAGSERVGRTEVDGERLKESQFINKSLSALGDVIFALASKSSHIPYRNSKLTHLLQSSLGGDCKALMFVQISPSAADLGESLCSLNFASRVRGIEQGAARKQIDPTENFKLKQMAEKLKHEEKETMKLQDSLHSMQIKYAAREQQFKYLKDRYAAREQQFKYLKDRVKDLENQLTEERKLRLQQEAKAAVVAATKSSAVTVQAVKKPPLGPLRSREPLRRITNFLPSPLPPPPSKFVNMLSTSLPTAEKDKDSETDTKALMRPRRVSVAVRPVETMQANQPRPKRQRASIATLRPDAKLISAMNAHRTPNSPSQNAATMARRLFPNDARRKSRIFTPPRFPAFGRSKFLGSPPGVQQQGSSWKPKPPTAVAVQRRHFVWSPLRQRTQKNERKSLPPSRLAQNQ